jgi:microcystin-dependent protein
MSCSNCGNNSLTGCSCSDNCPNQSSEINFDGILSSINVPNGSNINVVFALLEEFVITTVSGLDLSYTVLAGNCLGIPAGEYGYDQMFDALTVALCALNIEVDGLADALAAFEITINSQILDIQTDITDIQTEITDINITLTDTMPIGAMIMYPIAVTPSPKWELCEGQTLATALYPDLFSVVGYNFGGAGAFFSLPDMRSKFIVGYDAIAAPEYQTIGQGGGQDSVTLTSSESGLVSHTHAASTTGVIGGSKAKLTTATDNGITPADDGRIRIAADSNLTVDDERQQNTHTHSFSGSTTISNNGDQDANEAHENRPSFIVFPWIIKVAI